MELRTWKLTLDSPKEEDEKTKNKTFARFERRYEKMIRKTENWEGNAAELLKEKGIFPKSLLETFEREEKYDKGWDLRTLFQYTELLKDEESGDYLVEIGRLSWTTEGGKMSADGWTRNYQAEGIYLINFEKERAVEVKRLKTEGNGLSAKLS